MDRQLKQLFHDFNQQKQELDDIKSIAFRQSSQLRQISLALYGSKRCTCGGKFVWVYDDDRIVVGQCCARCNKKWWF